MQLLAEEVKRTPEIGNFQSENHVRVADQCGTAYGLVERVARGEVHAAALVDDRSLQELSQFDKQGQSGRGARQTVCDDQGIFRAGQQAGCFGNGPGVALRRRGQS